jgi:hypothetical protein
MAEPDLFHRLSTAMCGPSPTLHCLLNTFIVFPCVALFVVMAPFVFQWFEADTAEDAALAADEEVDSSTGPKRLHTWKPWASDKQFRGRRDDSLLLGQAHARFVQSTAISIIQGVCSLGLALSAILQLIFQKGGQIADEDVFTGTTVWALTSFFAWLANGGAVVLRGWRRCGVPDYLQSWYTTVSHVPLMFPRQIMV